MTEQTTHTERDDVRGFMTCRQGLALAHGYFAIADVMNAVGLRGEAGWYATKGNVAADACTPCPR